jgi:hypothetical protein
MNTLEKQNIKQLKQIIDQVKAASKTDMVLIVNTEEQVKMFEELLPCVKVICTNGHLESDDKCYIIPCEEKPIKIIYE